MKRFICKAVGVSMAFLLLTGCGGSKSLNIDPTTAVEQMSKEITFTDQFAAINSESANKVYGVDSDLVESCSALAGSGATAESIAMWKAVDEKSAQKIEEQLHIFVEGYIEGYSEYKPEEVPKLKSAIIETKGVYVVLCISADNESAKTVVDDTLKG